jgi:integrase
VGKKTGDMQYLYEHKGSWRVRVRIPEQVRDAFPDKDGKPKRFLTESLGIPLKDEARAVRAKHAVVGRMFEDIERAKQDLTPMEWRPVLRRTNPYHSFGLTYRLSRELVRVGDPDPVDDDVLPSPALVSTKVLTFAAEIEKKFGSEKSDAKRDTTTKLTRFSEWLGFDDMYRVTRKLGNGYVDSMVEEGELSDKSISNHLKAIKALFSYAVGKTHLEVEHDPLEKVKFNPADGKKQPPFSPEDRKVIFAACENATPFLKWFNLLGLFSGMRNSEILRGKKESIRQIDGVWCFVVQGVTKTNQSVRTIPLHSAICDGFRAYVEILPAGSKLFPAINGNSSKLLREFFDGMGIDRDVTDEQLEAENRRRKSFYSHRHFLITHFRRRDIRVDDDIKRYLTAHGKGDVHAGYGEYPATDLQHAIETIPIP